MTSTFVPAQCARCGETLNARVLSCPRCGLFTRIRELQELTDRAIPLESVNKSAAALVWNDVLALLPPESAEYQQIVDRIAVLTGTSSHPRIGSRMLAGDASASAGLDEAADEFEDSRDIPPREPDSIAVATLKTIVSMLVSVVVYHYLARLTWTVSLGFVVLMLVHEMGHVFAIWYYHMRAGPPIFVPYMGALIDLRQDPPNAKVEAIIGIGGPLLGTIGACIVYLVTWKIDCPNWQGDLLLVANLGFQLNLFNLLPVPPLDGGRITAAVSPWLWMLGLVGLVAIAGLIWMQTGQLPTLMLIVLLFALPRVLGMLQRQNRELPYYQTSTLTRWSIGLLYLTLLASLLFLTVHSIVHLV